MSFLLAIDGIDGSGKSTLARSLAARLRTAPGVEVVQSREPTEGAWGAQLRAGAKRDREREIELAELDRREHVERVIRPALARGALVILDRYYYSTAAYQARDEAQAAEILVKHQAFAPRPDLALVLDVEIETALARIGRRGAVRDAFEQRSSLLHAQQLFRFVAQLAPEARLFDATHSARELDLVVWTEVIRVVRERAPKFAPVDA